MPPRPSSTLLLSSVIVSSDANRAQQADEGGPSTRRLFSQSGVRLGPEPEREFHIMFARWSLEHISFEDIVHAGSFLLLPFFASFAYRDWSELTLLLFLCVASFASELFQFSLITRSGEWRVICVPRVPMS